MHYFYIDECVVVIQGWEYQVKSMYAYFDSCLDVFQWILMKVVSRTGLKRG